MCVLGTSDASLTHVLDLIVDARPEHAVASISLSELNTTVSCVELVKHSVAEREGNDDTVLFKEEPIV